MGRREPSGRVARAPDGSCGGGVSAAAGVKPRNRDGRGGPVTGSECELRALITVTRHAVELIADFAWFFRGIRFKGQIAAS